MLSQLDVVSLLRVAATCSELYALASDGYLWHNLCARDFGPAGEGRLSGINWYVCKAIFASHCMVCVIAGQQSMSGPTWGQDWKEVGAGSCGGGRCGRGRIYMCTSSHALQVYKKIYLSRKASRERRPEGTVLDIPVSTEHWPPHPPVPGVIGQWVVAIV